jgi:hypothetical protein
MDQKAISRKSLDRDPGIFFGLNGFTEKIRIPPPEQRLISQDKDYFLPHQQTERPGVLICSSDQELRESNHLGKKSGHRGSQNFKLSPHVTSLFIPVKCFLSFKAS